MSISESDAALRLVEAGRQRMLARLREAFTRQISADTELGDVDPAVLDRMVSEAGDRAGASLWRISLAEAAADEFGLSVSDALAHPAVVAAQRLIDAPAVPQVPPAAAGPAPTGDRWTPLTPAPEPAAAPAGAWGAPARTPQAAPPPRSATPSSPPPRSATPPPPAPPPAKAVPPSTPAAEAEPTPSPEPEPQAVPEPAADAASTADAAPAQALRISAVHTGGIETLKPGDKDIELRLSDAGLDVIKRSSGVAIGRLDWSEVTSVDLESAKRGLRGKRRSLEVRTARGQAAFDLPGLSDAEADEHLEPMLDRLRASRLAG